MLLWIGSTSLCAQATVENISVIEGTSNAVVTVTLPGAAPVGGTTVLYAITANTAVEGLDYTVPGDRIVIPEGISTGTISIPIIGDTTTEDLEDFSISVFTDLANDAGFNSAGTFWTPLSGTNVCTPAIQATLGTAYAFETNPETIYGGSNSSNQVLEVDCQSQGFQNIPTINGVTYTVNFKASRRTAGGPNPASVTVAARNAGTSALLNQLLVTKTNTTFNLATETFLFTATSNSTRIDFTTTNNQGVGLIFDDLSIVPQTADDSATITIVDKTPGDVGANLSLWLKADVGGAAWTDQSGNNTTVTANGTPSLNTNSLNFNDQIAFNGTADYYDLTNAAFENGTGDKAIYVVSQRNTDAGAIYMVSLGTIVNPASNSINFGHWNNFINDPFVSGNAFELTSNDGSWLVNTPAITGYSLTAGIDALYTNGVSLGIAQDNVNVDLLGGTDGKIGAFANSSGFWSGDIAEVIVYNDATTAGRAQIESYLAIKYGITLNSGATAYLDSAGNTVWAVDATYANDIFGIARDDASGLNQEISKSVNNGAVLTVATNTDFTTANDGSRTDLFNQQFLMIGNDGNSGASGDAVSTDLETTTYYERSAREWKSVNTGLITNPVSLQFDGYDDTWVLLKRTINGDFSATTGTTASPLSATGTVTTTLPGTTFFTLARLATSIEFEAAAASADENAAVSNLPNLLIDGTLNEDTNIDVVLNAAGTATLGTDYTFGGNTAALPQTITVSIPAGTYTAASPVALAGLDLGKVNQFDESYAVVRNDPLVPGGSRIDGERSIVAPFTGTYEVTLSAETFSSASTPDGLVRVGTTAFGSSDIFDGGGDRINEITPSKTYTINLTQGTTYFFTAIAGGGSVLTDVDMSLDYLPGPLNFAITDETIVEADETIDLTLSNAQSGLVIQEITGGALIDNHIYTITNDDTINVEFASQTAASTDETAADNLPQILVNGQTDTDITFDVIFNTFDSGTAIAGTDYTFTSPTQVTILANTAYDGTTATALSIPAFSIVSDDLVEGDETVGFELSNFGTGAQLNDVNGDFSITQGSIYTITDDDIPEVQIALTPSGGNFIGFADPEISYAEAGNLNYVVRATISGATLIDPLTVTIQNTALTTLDVNDIVGTAFPTTITIAAGETFGDSASIQILNDNVAEPNEKYEAEVVPSADYTIGTANETFELVVVNDDISVEFDNATYAALEDAGTLTLNLSVSGAVTTIAETIDIDITGGTATILSDYTFADPTTVTIPADDYTTAKTVSVDITLVDNEVIEPDETIELALINPSANVSVGSQNTSVATISNDDNVIIEFASGIGASSDESTPDNFVQFLVKGESEQELTFDLSILTFLSSATDGGTDYTLVTPVTLTIPANTNFDGLTPTSLDLTGFSLNDDSLVEGNETIVFDISNFSPNLVEGDVSGDFAFADLFTYTITDDDVAAFTVTPTTLTVGENGGTGTFTVVLDAQPATDVVINVTSNAIAEGTVDVATLTFTNTDWNIPQTVTVTGVDDSAIGDDTVLITLSIDDAASDDAFDPVSDQVVNATFTDDDTANFTVVATTTTLPEGTTETFTVVLTAQPATDVVLDITSSATAEATTDVASVTFTNANWDTPQTVTVQSVEDTNLGDDTADITIAVNTAGSDAVYAAVTSQMVAYTFTNNDVEVTISASASDDEATGGNLPVLLINGTTTVASAVTVSVTGGDAVAGSDFTFTSPQIINVPAGTYDGTAATGIAITGLSITDENAVEPDETIDFEISVPTGQLVLGATTTSTYTIINDDSVIVAFNTAAASDAEATGGNLPTLFLTGEVVNASTVNVALDVSGTATVGTDFTFTTIQVVNIPVGVYDGTAATAIAIPTLSIIDDNLIDPGETIVLNLETPTGDVSLGAITSHTYTITDDETVGFTASETALTIAEDGGTGTFTVVLTAQPVSDVVIDISSSDLLEATTAVTSLTFTNANWNVPQTVTVTGVNDNVIAADTATITAAVNDPGSDDDFDALTDQTVAITLTDDDTAGFTVSPLALIVNENGGTGTFTVVLNAQPDSDVVFDITSADVGEATVDLSTLTFTAANWDVPQTITVTGVDDPQVVDQNTSITIAVNDAGSDDNFDPLADQTVTVDLPNEDIVVGPTLTTAGPYVVDENGGTVTVGVVLGSQPATDVVIDYVVSDPLQGTTSVTQMTFTNANWDISQTLTFTGIDDTDITGDFDVTFTATVNNALSDDSFDGGVVTATITVIDDDLANLAVSIAAGIAPSEPATNGTFTVSVVGGAVNSTGAAITGDVSYSGTAADGTDFNGDATYSIAIGVSSATVTLATQDDFEIEGGETIIATISNPSVGTINVDNANLTIGDDDSIDVTATGTQITTADGVALANGTDTETVSVQLKDAAGNNLLAAGVQVTFALTGSATATSLTVVTDANGLAQIDITNTIAQTVQVTATVDTDNNVTTPEVAVVNGSPASVVFSVDNTNPDGNNANTTIAAISPIVADGTATSTVTVTLADANGNLLTAGGATIVLATTGSAVQVGAVTDNLDGTYTATFSNTLAETVTITGTVNGQAILDDATIEFTSDNANPDPTNVNTTIAATSPVVADGTAISTVTVTLADANGNLLTAGGATIDITSNSTTATLVGSIVDNTDGTYTATYSNTVAEDVIFSATVNTVAITTGDPTVTYTPDNTNPDPTNVNTTITATSPVVADGTAISTLTVTLADANGNALTAGGATVGITSDSTTATQVGTVIDNGDGTYTAFFSNTVAEDVIFSATVNTVAITTGDPTVTYTSDNSNPDPTNVNTTITATSPVVADGTATSTVTVTLADVNGNVLTAGGATVGITSDSTTATLVGSIVDNTDGTYTATYSNTVAEDVIFSATVNTVAITTGDPTVTYTPDNTNPDPTNVNTTIAATSPVVADGTATSTVTVTLADANGNLLTAGGATVAITPNSTTATLVGTILDNADGTYTATYSNTVAEDVIFSATVNTVAITTGDPTVTYTSDNTNPDPTNANTTITATSPVVADGIATSTVTVTLSDANGNALTAGGATVGITSDSTTATLVGAIVDNGDGTYTAQFSNTTAESVTISATVDGTAITTGDATVVFESDNTNPDPTNVNTTITATGPVNANGTDVSTVTVQLADASGNLITTGGETVVLAVTGNAVLVSGVTDNGDGIYTATFSNLLVESVTITGTLNGTTISDNAVISFILDTDPNCTVNCDDNNDGTCDRNCDDDGNGTCDRNCDDDNDGTCDRNCDDDNDGTCDRNCDDNNDGTCDRNCDDNNDGTCDRNCDDDNDGTCDRNCDDDNDGTCDRNCDDDNDGTCDRNCDDNNDGTCDRNCDDNNDGTCDRNCDDDNDGICDRNCDDDNDGTCDRNCDNDGDGTCDIYCDDDGQDNDGDGVPDIIECPNNPNCPDTDNDGIPDYRDDDDDGDGIPNNEEDTDNDGDPTNDDCDNDGVPNFLDSDSCGITDIPKGFSPNGDGVNDTWVIPGIEAFPNHQIRLFNRWGSEVFSAVNYQNDWNGVSNGKRVFGSSSDQLPPGAYYYIIETGTNDVPSFTGWIYINY